MRNKSITKLPICKSVLSKWNKLTETQIIKERESWQSNKMEDQSRSRLPKADKQERNKKKKYGRSKIFWHLLCHLQVCLSAFWVISSFLRLKTVLNRTLGQTTRNFNSFGLQFINCQSLGIILQPIIKLGYLLIVPTSCRHLDNKDKFRDIYNIYRNMIIPLINQPIDNRLTTNTQIEQKIGLVW